MHPNHAKSSFIYVLCYLLFLSVLFGTVALLGWQDGWRVFGFIPHAEIYNDARVLQGALRSAEAGYDPTVENPFHFGGKLMNYPLIWMTIGDWLGIVNETRFVVWVTSYLVIYIAAVAWLLFYFPSVTLLIAAVSGAAVWVFEIGNNDTIFFSLLLFAAMAGNRLLSATILLFSAILKLYPIFGIMALISWEQRGKLVKQAASAFIVALLFLGYLFWNLESILHAVDITPKGGGYSYGLWTVAFLIDERLPGTPITLNTLLILQAVITLPLFVYCRHLARWLGIDGPSETPTATRIRDLFLFGAAIYVASYVLTGNWDYRMIFVIFTIPFMVRIESKIVRVLFTLSVATGMNFAYLTGIQAEIGGALNILGKAALQYILSAALIAYCVPRLLDMMQSLRVAPVK